MTYWCVGCQTILTKEQVEFFHSLGLVCKLCRSGRVTPMKEDQ